MASTSGSGPLTPMPSIVTASLGGYTNLVDSLGGGSAGRPPIAHRTNSLDQQQQQQQLGSLSDGQLSQQLTPPDSTAAAASVTTTAAAVASISANLVLGTPLSPEEGVDPTDQVIKKRKLQIYLIFLGKVSLSKKPGFISF